MRFILTICSIWFFIGIGFSQKSYHVFPKDHPTNKGTLLGDGSIQRPWDLQTALSQKNGIVKGGDTIWLHAGTYSGRFISKLESKEPEKNIIVSSFKNEWAVLNGNVDSEPSPVLTIRGSNVTYQNFEISPRGTLIKDENHVGFRQFSGISHQSGTNCEFINLIIHSNNGLGFGSWNKTGGSLISHCIVYNNGYKGNKNKGLGEGLYVQNSSDDEIRIIKNNIIFNNYYKGIEVWSANRKAEKEYVKNIILENNVVFNSGLPSGKTVDNIIIASDDRNSINIAKNIWVRNNILYHNTDYSKNEVNGDAPSITIGYYHKSPVEDIHISNNIILGRNNPMRLLYAKSISVTNNIFYGGYIHLMSETPQRLLPGSINGNTYYTKNKTPFKVGKKKMFFKDWQSAYKQDLESNHKSLKQFKLPSVLNISKNDYNSDSYRVVLFSKDESPVSVDFSQYVKGSDNIGFTVRDVEDLNAILLKGKLNDMNTIVIPMNKLEGFNKSLNNFGVYIVEFERETKNLESEQENFFRRFFRWLF